MIITKPTLTIVLAVAAAAQLVQPSTAASSVRGRRSLQQEAQARDSLNAGTEYGAVDPAQAYVPFFDLLGVKDCPAMLNQGLSIEGVDCGLEFPPPANSSNSSLSWAYGTAHRSQNEAGSSNGANWIALDKLGSSDYAPDGMMLALFNLTDPGSLRDPHWHSNSAEITYVIEGTARVTVTALPRKSVSGAVKQAGSSGSSGGRYSSGRRLDGDDGALNHVWSAAGSTVEMQERPSETFLIGPGDAFFSPVGYHHYFEGVSSENPLFGVALFDTSDLRTFDLPQVMKNMPVDVLVSTLGLTEEQAANMYRGSRRVLTNPIPGWQNTSLSNATLVPDDLLEFKAAGLDTQLSRAPRSEVHGQVATRSIDKDDWPALAAGRFSLAYTELAPGAMLEAYWMDNADELVYVIAGEDLKVRRMGNGGSGIGGAGTATTDTFTIRQGYAAMLEIGVTWYITNEGTETAKLIRAFNSNAPTLTTVHDAYQSLPETVAEGMMQPAYGPGTATE